MRQGSQVRMRQGFLSIQEVADMFQVPHHRFRNWLWRGALPKPRTPFGGSKRKYYVGEDVRVIGRLVAK
jgi:hypothetical protein